MTFLDAGVLLETAIAGVSLGMWLYESRRRTDAEAELATERIHRVEWKRKALQWRDQLADARRRTLRPVASLSEGDVEYATVDQLIGTATVEEPT